ncbi:Peptidyl-tRNA hydrolase [Reticulomyxa filosa]|uniref:Peptidyl-tRNA hydrolase n=1 Tax=Reticulomyxa filosa TaxID=46433 RepID=X6NB54_RETFI|nr:Peptidyl-tRNA hydrolase [Reticulomyxa filosa]|eukprot:ETO22547.1 Peptidyl-tRNA hydrolase [Reticulomyxa filosa]
MTKAVFSWKTGISGRSSVRLWKPLERIPRVYVGVGNPTNEYKDCRHNIGRDFLDYFAKQLCLQWHNIAINEQENKKENHAHKNQLPNQNIGLECQVAYFREGSLLFVKSNRYMNMTGVVLSQLLNEMRRPIQDVVIIHDCLYTKFGTWRHQRGKGHL